MSTVINIKNLIGTLVIVGDEKSAQTQIVENVNHALLKVLESASKPKPKPKVDPSRAESLEEVKSFNKSVGARVTLERESVFQKLNSLTQNPE